MQIGFIGAGKVGFSLGKHFSTHGINVTGYYSQNPQSANEAAEFTATRSFSSMETVLQESDTVFLTVPDGEIKTVWDHIKHLSVKNKKICHCSGCISATVFDGIEALGAFGYSVHPLYAISSKRCSYEELTRAVFTLEGSSFYLGQMKAMLEQAGSPVQLISGEQKALYHAAAVFASNHMVALAETAQKLLRQCGFSEELSQKALIPLMLGNVQKICEVGTTEAMTGPVERADTGTVSAHLSCLSQQEKELYCLLSRVLVTVGQRKHPQRDYTTLQMLLETAVSQAGEQPEAAKKETGL